MLCRCYIGEPSSTTVATHSQKRSLLCTSVPHVIFFSLAGDCPPAPFLMYIPSSRTQVGTQGYLIPSPVQLGAALHLLECIPLLPCTDSTRSVAQNQSAHGITPMPNCSLTWSQHRVPLEKCCGSDGPSPYWITPCSSNPDSTAGF